MKARMLSAIGLAVVVAVGAIAWHMGRTPVLFPDPASDAAGPVAILPESAENIADAAAPLEDPDFGQGREDPVAAVPADALAARQQALADAMYRAAGGRVVETLADSGLAPTDSERLARRYTSALSECATMTLRMEADRQSISVQMLIDRLEAAMDFGDVNLADVDFPDVIARLSETMDLVYLGANLFPCLTNAAQQAGVPLDLVLEIMQEILPATPSSK